jgi:C-terminal processing protease CtpA/Prc
VLYKVQVATHAAVLPDGARLEGVGVTPDVLALPGPDDLAAHRDPVLAQAAALFGVTLDPRQAGRISRQ